MLARLRFLRPSWPLAATAAVLVLSACEGGNAGTSSQTDPLVEDFATRAAAAYCEHVGACCRGGSQTPLEECKATYRQWVLLTHERDGGTLHQASADACLAHYASYDCDAARDYVTCSDVFRTAAFRTRQVGESCTTSSDCALPERGGASCSDNRGEPRVCGTYYSVPEQGELRDSAIDTPACH